MLKSIVGKLGVTSVLISVVAVSVAVGIIIYKSNELVYSKPISISTIEVASYNAQDLKRFDQYKTIIDSALKVKAERLDERSLKMFGYTDGEVLAKINMEEQIYDLSMVYESEKGRYAVINDKFYKPGDTLPDGSKVQEVSMAGVVIVNNGLANILSVEKKLDAPVNGPITRKLGLRNRKEDEVNSPENVVKAVQKIQKIQESMRVLQNSQINDFVKKETVMMSSKGNLVLKDKMSGFTLVELGLYLLAAGVLTAAFTYFAKVSINQKDRLKTVQSIENIKIRIIDYALRNNRLPCTDSNADGLENCPSSAAGKGVPYKTLQLNQAPISSAGGSIVYRPDPSLTIKGNVDDPQWKLSVQDKYDFCLLIRTSMNTLLATDPAIINNGTSCSAETKTYPAFILADSGKLNADGLRLNINQADNLFDGQNSETNNCYESPMRGISNRYDDTVITLGKAALAGMVCK